MRNPFKGGSTPSLQDQYRSKKPKTNPSVSTLTVSSSLYEEPSPEQGRSSRIFDIKECQGSRSSKESVPGPREARKQQKPERREPADWTTEAARTDQEASMELTPPRIRRDTRTHSWSSKSAMARWSTASLSPPGQLDVSASQERSAINMQEAVSLLQELRKVASPEDLVALHKALLPTREGQSGTSADQYDTDRNTDSRLIRRRSFVPPGLPTRLPSAQELVNAMPESKAQSNNSSGGSSGKPSLEDNYAEFEDSGSGHDRFRSMRSSTPGELDFGLLGGFERGPLTVRNGAAHSPSPSITAAPLTAPPVDRLKSPEEEYFNASERCSAEDTGKESVMRPSEPTQLPNEFQTKYAGKAAQNLEAWGSRPQGRSHSMGTRPEIARQLSSGWLCPAPDAQPQLVRSASSRARDYICELPASPFSRMEFPADMTLNTPRGSEEKGNEDSPPQAANDAGANYVQASEPPPVPARADRPKLDSGYSSCSSLLATRKPKDVPTPAKASAVLGIDVEREQNNSLVSFDDFAKSVPATAEPRTSASTERPSTGRKSFFRSRSLSKSFSRPSLSKSAVSEPAVPTLAGQTTEKARPKTPKKLQKKRPFSQDIVAQMHQPIAEAPPLPTDVVTNFSRRLDSSPDIDHIPRTYASADRAEPVDDLSSTPPPTVPIRFPTPDGTPQRLKSGSRFEDDSSDSSEQSPPKPAQHRHSFSAFRRRSASLGGKVKPSKQTAHETEKLVDLSSPFGTVAESLGSSPYDIAITPEQVRSMSNTPNHRNRMTTTFTSAKGQGNPSGPSESMSDLRPTWSLQHPQQQPKSKTESQSPQPDRSRPIAVRRKSVARSSSRGRQSLETVRERPESQQQAPPVPTIPKAHSEGSSPVPSRAPTRLERRTTEPPAPIDTSLGWETQAKAWSERRKSLGEGLLHQAQTITIQSASPTPMIVVSRSITPIENENKMQVARNTALAELQGDLAPPVPLHRSRSAEVLSPSVTKKSPAASMASHTSKYSRGQSFEGHDRYAGGLDYNYEGWGRGLADSAGTRGPEKSASRKSLTVSEMYGLDLSDVPVFLRKMDASPVYCCGRA